MTTVRRESTRALKAGIFSSRTGSAGGDSILRGFIGETFFHTRKSRCGPVLLPVDPTYPITSPWCTIAPARIPGANLDRWR